MKPKLTTENKAKIFALYWGQAVIDAPKKYDFLTGKFTPLALSNDEFDDMYELDKAWAELRPLSSITDEELKIMESLVVKAKTYLKIITSEGFSKEEADQLRLMGFAVPWCGWSVEELVKEGVFKLK